MNLIILRQRWKGISISILWTAFKNQSLFLNRCLVLKESGYFKSHYIYNLFEHNFYPSINISSAQQLSHVLLTVTPQTTTPQASLSITNSQSLLKLMPMEWVMLSNQLILCCPHLLCLQFFPASGFFSNKSVLQIRWPEYWNFSFSISPSNEYFRTDYPQS